MSLKRSLAEELSFHHRQTWWHIESIFQTKITEHREHVTEISLAVKSCPVNFCIPSVITFHLNWEVIRHICPSIDTILCKMTCHQSNKVSMGFHKVGQNLLLLEHGFDLLT